MLTKFATTPAKIHYTCLKGIALHLCKTIDWGIIYSVHALSPPFRMFPFMFLHLCDPTLPLVPQAHDHFQLYGHLDASHTNNLCQSHSTTGYVFLLLSGGIVAYHSKTHSLTTTSSMEEAEIIAAVSSDKVAKYFHSILAQLGFT
jgi:hypothetical protein